MAAFAACSIWLSTVSRSARASSSLDDAEVLERIGRARARRRRRRPAARTRWRRPRGCRRGTGCPGPRPCWPLRPGRRCRRTARRRARRCGSSTSRPGASRRWSGTLATPTLGSLVAKAYGAASAPPPVSALYSEDLPALGRPTNPKRSIPNQGGYGLAGGGASVARAASGVAGQAVHRPAVHPNRAEADVEVDGRRVPVEHRPLQPAVPSLDAAPRQRGQQGLAVALAPARGRHVQVLEVDAVAAEPGREAEEPDGQAHDVALHLGHVAEDRRLRAEEHVVELRLGGHRLLGRPLVLGQLPHELNERGHVSGQGGPDHAPTLEAPPWRAPNGFWREIVSPVMQTRARSPGPVRSARSPGCDHPDRRAATTQIAGLRPPRSPGCDHPGLLARDRLAGDADPRQIARAGAIRRAGGGP